MLPVCELSQQYSKFTEVYCGQVYWRYALAPALTRGCPPCLQDTTEIKALDHPTDADQARRLHDVSQVPRDFQSLAMPWQ